MERPLLRIPLTNTELRARLSLLRLATGRGLRGACRAADLPVPEMKVLLRGRWPLAQHWAVRLIEDGYGIPLHSFLTPSRADFARYLLERTS